MIFGWETTFPSYNNHPAGIEANCIACTITNPTSGPNATIVNGTANEIFAAIGSLNFTTPGAKPFLKITALGPENGGPLSSTIQWLGAYGQGNNQGVISQISGMTGFGYSVSNYFFSRAATQVVPEPASLILAATMVGAFCSLRQRRRAAQIVVH